MKWYAYIPKLIYKLADDTLRRTKEDGVRRFSATRLTMFTAWVMVSFSYIKDVLEEGYRHDRFLLMVGIATGMKVTDAISKAINKKEQ